MLRCHDSANLPVVSTYRTKRHECGSLRMFKPYEMCDCNPKSPFSALDIDCRKRNHIPHLEGGADTGKPKLPIIQQHTSCHMFISLKGRVTEWETALPSALSILSQSSEWNAETDHVGTSGKDWQPSQLLSLVLHSTKQLQRSQGRFSKLERTQPNYFTKPVSL